MKIVYITSPYFLVRFVWLYHMLLQRCLDKPMVNIGTDTELLYVLHSNYEYLELDNVLTPQRNDLWLEILGNHKFHHSTLASWYTNSTLKYTELIWW